MAPSMTTPARPRWMAEWVASSPQMAGPTPPASMTSTSPGLGQVDGLHRFGPIPGVGAHRQGRPRQAHPRGQGAQALQHPAPVQGVGEIGDGHHLQHPADLLGAAPLKQRGGNDRAFIQGPADLLGRGRRVQGLGDGARPR